MTDARTTGEPRFALSQIYEAVHRLAGPASAAIISEDLTGRQPDDPKTPMMEPYASRVRDVLRKHLGLASEGAHFAILRDLRLDEPAVQRWEHGQWVVDGNGTPWQYRTDGDPGLVWRRPGSSGTNHDDSAFWASLRYLTEPLTPLFTAAQCEQRVALDEQAEREE